MDLPYPKPKQLFSNHFSQRSPGTGAATHRELFLEDRPFKFQPQHALPECSILDPSSVQEVNLYTDTLDGTATPPLLAVLEVRVKASSFSTIAATQVYFKSLNAILITDPSLHV